MNTYIALLRGINVGGNNKVEMKTLKALFEGLGFEKVVTYINSGNVVFQSAKKVDVSTLEKTFQKTFGFAIRVVIRDKENITKLVKAIPREWENDLDQKTDILFLWDEFDTKESLNLLTLRDGVDNVMYVPGAIVWNLEKKNYGKSGMNKLIGTPLYKNTTARNVNTVRKLAILMNEG